MLIMVVMMIIMILMMMILTMMILMMMIHSSNKNSIVAHHQFTFPLSTCSMPYQNGHSSRTAASVAVSQKRKHHDQRICRFG